jgi:hypothetical protein
MKKYLPHSKVAERYGVHTCTIDRWRRDPEMNFPKGYRIKGRKYDENGELDAWDASRQEAAES